MKALGALLTVLVLLSEPAHASLVTLESQWCCGGVPGTLTFTYDDSTPDSVDDEGLVIDNNNPQVGSYQNAIVAANYVVTSGANTGKTFTLIADTPNSIVIRRYPGVLGPASVRINASVFDGTDIVEMSMRVEGIPPLTDDLSELPFTVVADDTTLFIGPPLTPIRYENNRLFKEVPSVPVPASAWLFASSLLGLVVRLKKQK